MFSHALLHSAVCMSLNSLILQELFVDHHVKAHVTQLPAGQQPRPEYLLPLAGAQVSRMPKYRSFNPMSDAEPITEKERLVEARQWSAAFAEDYRYNIAVGQMHEHKDTCFKYVVEKGARKSKHCQFRSLVSLLTIGAAKQVVSPRSAGTFLEGGSNGPAQVSLRGNCDFQNMLRTFKNYGFFGHAHHDDLRDPLPDEAAVRANQEDIELEASLSERIKEVVESRKEKGLPPRSVLSIGSEFLRAHGRR